MKRGYDGPRQGVRRKPRLPPQRAQPATARLRGLTVQRSRLRLLPLTAQPQRRLTAQATQVHLLPLPAQPQRGRLQELIANPQKAPWPFLCSRDLSR